MITAKTIYLSGPIDPVTQFSFEHYEIRKALKEKGYAVFDRAILPIGLAPDAYCRIGHAILRECDTIYMLEGFSGDEETMNELANAIALNKNLMYQNADEAAKVQAVVKVAKDISAALRTALNTLDAKDSTDAL